MNFEDVPSTSSQPDVPVKKKFFPIQTGVIPRTLIPNFYRKISSSIQTLSRGLPNEAGVYQKLKGKVRIHYSKIFRRYEYKFESKNDIQMFWYHLRAIALSTPMNVRNMSEEETEKSDGSKFFQVLVRIISGKIITVDVDASETAMEVKMKIFAQEGIPPVFQRLQIAGKPFNDQETFFFHAAKKFTTLQLMLPLRGGSRLQIKCLSGGDLMANNCVYLADVNASTVAEIKSYFVEQKGVPVNALDLYYRGKKLREDYDIRKIKSSIFLVHKIKNGVHIRVETFKGQSIQLYVKPTDTVDYVKRLIRILEEISVEVQDHIFSGIVFRNNSKFAQKLTVKNDNTVRSIQQKISEMTGLVPEAQEIVFLDLRASNSPPVFEDNNTENETVYYVPQSLIQKAYDYLRSNDPTQAGEKAWASAFYSVKMLYLQLQVHNTSHSSNKWLADFAIDTMEQSKRTRTKKLFEKAELCHKIFCGSQRCTAEIFESLLDDVEEFIREWQTIDINVVSAQLNAFINDRSSYDDGKIKFREANGILKEFGGIFNRPYKYEFS
uniref:Ubiquitin-like domain-containing protein n=1 Tax=Panagrolaimus sp. ES5 TaxID=591445 RepID=A0AC34FMQ8_9BILA